MARHRAALAGETGAHTVPVIRTMIGLVELLADRNRPMTTRALAEALGASRSTIYRIINTLVLHDWMTPAARSGEFRLGAGLARVGRAAGADPLLEVLPELALPILEAAAEETGETHKLSVLSGSEVAVIATALGRSESALVAHVGVTTPLPLGASAKVLLSGLSREDLDRRLQGKAPATLTDDLARVAAQGWARDDGEFDRAIGAHAAPVVDGEGRIVAAVSVVYLRSKAERNADHFRSAAISAASRIAGLLPRKGHSAKGVRHGAAVAHGR